MIALLLLPLTLRAHSASDSILTLDLTGNAAQLRWDIALRDLDQAVRIDRDGDAVLTWGEVRARHADIAAYALSHLRIASARGACALLPGSQSLVDRNNGTYTVLPLTLDCAGAAPTRLDYSLLFDLDAGHRGLLRLIDGHGERLSVLSPERPSLELSPVSGSETFGEYWREGVRHIWGGLDHLLFLLTLLLPAVLRRDASGWRAACSVRTTLGEVVAVATAFTLAHSVTLSLAVFGLLSLPARLVESTIAATLVLAALHNLRPFLPGPRWAIAFALGLVHGLGFAAALADLDPSTVDLVVALAGFNLGVESGQLAIVALFVPTAYLLRNWRPYRIGAVQYGSAAVAVVAFGWLAERVTGLDLMGF